MDEKIPAISVIVPMYNVEKYIFQCLDSVLTQTFKDYEVLVIDDCSTDKSVKIVEAIIEQRTPEALPRLRLIKLNENSGTASLPRNIGIRLARSRYVTFVDSDDVITVRALEILFNAAERFDADVVHAERFYMPTGTGDQIVQETVMKRHSFQAPPFVDKPALETNDLGERIRKFCQTKFLWWGCNKLFRRDFLIENRIEFADARSIEDLIFTFSCLCCAKNYVRIPDIFYVYRQSENSITRSARTVEKRFKRWIPSLVRGVNHLDAFLSRLEFFKAHPELRMAVVNFLIERHLTGESAVYAKFAPHLFESMLRREMRNELGESAEVIATYLFNLVNRYYLRLHPSLMTLSRK